MMLSELGGEVALSGLEEMTAPSDAGEAGGQAGAKAKAPPTDPPSDLDRWGVYRIFTGFR